MSNSHYVADDERYNRMLYRRTGLSGVRLSCQIQCEGGMTVRAISRLEGSGRPNPGPTPDVSIQPPPEWL